MLQSNVTLISPLQNTSIPKQTEIHVGTELFSLKIRIFYKKKKKK